METNTALNPRLATLLEKKTHIQEHRKHHHTYLYWPKHSFVSGEPVPPGWHGLTLSLLLPHLYPRRMAHTHTPPLPLASHKCRSVGRRWVGARPAPRALARGTPDPSASPTLLRHLSHARAPGTRAHSSRRFAGLAFFLLASPSSSSAPRLRSTLSSSSCCGWFWRWRAWWIWCCGVWSAIVRMKRS